MTGTILPDGSIGPIGGVEEKARAAAEQGYTTFLVPEGQSTITTYDKVIDKQQLANGRVKYDVNYVNKTINLQDEFKGVMTIKEVSNIEQAEKIFFSQ